VNIDPLQHKPLLTRKDASFTIVSRPEEKTPQRLEVKKAVAVAMQTGDDVVFIKRMRTKTGTSITVGVANIYQSVNQAKIVEPEYIRKRNSPPEKAKEATA
jgi:ribosomal protein S24E